MGKIMMVALCMALLAASAAYPDGPDIAAGELPMDGVTLHGVGERIPL